MTESIFRIEDLSLKTLYADAEGRILASEEDLFMVINRDYSRRTFVAAQKAVFLHCCMEGA